MLDNEFLTQDIDILPDAGTQEDADVTDILPDTPAEAPTEEVVDEAPVNPEVTDTTGDTELDDLLAGVTKSTEDVSENIDEASTKVEEIKDKVEEVQANPGNSDNMLKEIYQDLLQTETALQATEIARDVALGKVSELQTQVSELEINAAGNYQADNPDLMIVNKLLDAASGGSDVALPRVKNALNKLYLSLFNTSIEDGQVQDNLDGLGGGGVSLNEGTLPAGEIMQEEIPTDPNDIVSILG